MTAYVVLKNTDFTEGRGLMKLHKIFLEKKKAVNYIMEQDGVMGSAQPKKPYLSNNIEMYNGYDLVTMRVEQ